ncbi:MAG TPA: hypothetical protein VGF94_23505 [Kofleriaceae bacterium]|jgi:hypothetical protein
MSRSRFLSITSGGALAAFVACSGSSSPKPDAACGPGGAPVDGLVASSNSPSVTLTYGNLTGGANNDCPDAAAPAGVVSYTITGSQTDNGGGGLVTLCIPRPDLLPHGLTLGYGSDAGVQLIDFDGSVQATGCTYSLSTVAPTGTVSSSGECNNGTNAAGFALSFSGSMTLTETCITGTGAVVLSLGGQVAVVNQ